MADETHTTAAPRRSASGVVSRTDVLEIITSSSADGITIQDATGALVYANDAAARMCGYPSGEAMVRSPVEEIVAPFEILTEDGSAFPLEDLPGRRALRGEPEPEAILRFRGPDSRGDRWTLVRARPILTPAGHVDLVINVFMDIADERKKHLSDSFLAEATRQLSESIDWEETLQNVVRLAVPDMADWCAVDILEPDGSLSLIAIAHVEPTKVEWASELRRRFPPAPTDTSGVAHVVRTGRSERFAEITREMIEAAGLDSELRGIVDELGLSSVMYIPLVARGRILGALTMVWAESGHRYSDEDQRVAEDLASRAAFAIDNARLYRETDHVARSLQARLLPKKLPEIPGATIAARYLPADEVLQAGGDFYDLFEMTDGSWKAVIGDVCGKGPEAAALMGFVRFTTRAVSRQDRQPSEALVKLNTALVEELENGSGEFCTAAVVRIRPHDVGMTLTVAVAGHPLPFLVGSTGSVRTIGTAGDLLGVFEEISVTDEVVELTPGDYLVMVTDGILEADTASPWEDRGFPSLLASCAGLAPEAFADTIATELVNLESRRVDDVAMLILRCE